MDYAKRKKYRYKHVKSGNVYKAINLKDAIAQIVEHEAVNPECSDIILLD